MKRTVFSFALLLCFGATVAPQLRAQSDNVAKPSDRDSAGVGAKIFLERTPPPSDLKPERVRLSSGAAERLLMRDVRPDYPKEARKRHIVGTVVMTVIISAAGDVKEISLKEGDPTLAPAALAAAKQWKYKPYVLNGRAVEFQTTINIKFQLQ